MLSRYYSVDAFKNSVRTQNGRVTPYRNTLYLDDKRTECTRIVKQYQENSMT